MRGSPIRRTSTGVNTTVARLRAELADAQYDLDQTVTRAPTAGLSPKSACGRGCTSSPLPLRPAMVFVNTDMRDRALGAAFQQNSLQRVKAGDEAEIAFDAVPGRVFKGKVRIVLDAIAAGQLPATGALMDLARERRAAGRSPSSTSRRTCPAIKFRSAPPRRSRSTPSTGITSR